MKTGKSRLAVRRECLARTRGTVQSLSVRVATLTLLFAASSLSADTHYVSVATENPKTPFTTWATAATNIQQAVDAATAGDDVLVGDGVYATGSRVIYTPDGYPVPVRVFVSKAIELRSANGPQATVIDGGLRVACLAAVEGASVAGFTVRNGYYKGAAAGGINCYSTNVLAMDCVITGNYGSEGGGTYSGTLYNCTLSGNTAFVRGGGGVPPAGGEGGGAWHGVLYNCVLTGNTALRGGGAAYCILYNSVLTGNTAKGYPTRTLSGNPSYATGIGGGVSSSSVYNCMLTGNSSTDVGGGASSSSLYNCTLTGNSSTDICGGVHDSELYNCILYFNTVPKPNGGANYDSSSILYYCCTAPLPRTGSGNFSLSKHAVNTLFVDYAGGNLRLRSGSPCISAGNSAYVSTSTDLEGNPRIVGGIVDMGAYEFQGLPQ